MPIPLEVSQHEVREGNGQIKDSQYPKTGQLGIASYLALIAKQTD
jgi:hypothetical protein